MAAKRTPPSRHEILSRRTLLARCLLGAAATPLLLSVRAQAAAAEAPLLSVNDADAQKLHYTEDATQVKGVTAGNNCGTCALYLGAYGSQQGLCQAFPGKQVKAAGWCSSWAPQI